MEQTSKIPEFSATLLNYFSFMSFSLLIELRKFLHLFWLTYESS